MHQRGKNVLSNHFRLTVIVPKSKDHLHRARGRIKAKEKPIASWRPGLNTFDERLKYKMRKPWTGERTEQGYRAHCSGPRLCVCRNICDEVRVVAPFILLSSIRHKDDARPVLIVGEITCCCDPDYSHRYMTAACHKVLCIFHKGFWNSSIDGIDCPLYFKLLTCGLLQKRVQIKPRLPL